MASIDFAKLLKEERAKARAIVKADVKEISSGISGSVGGTFGTIGGESIGGDGLKKSKGEPSAHIGSGFGAVDSGNGGTSSTVSSTQSADSDLSSTEPPAVQFATRSFTLGPAHTIEGELSCFRVHVNVLPYSFPGEGAAAIGFQVTGCALKNRICHCTRETYTTQNQEGAGEIKHSKLGQRFP
jgi:hypothetical protein